MEYLHHLRDLNYITSEAVELAQAERDQPTHGIDLRPARQLSSNATDATK